MITKETARQIYNCHQQLEEIANIKEDMRNEVERVREQEKKDDRPISKRDCSFGKYGKVCNWAFPMTFLLQCGFSIYHPKLQLR